MGKRRRHIKRINNCKEGVKLEEESNVLETTWDDWWNRKEADMEERWRKREGELEEQLVGATKQTIDEKLAEMEIILKDCRKRQLEEMEEHWRQSEAALDAQWGSTVRSEVAHCTHDLEGACVRICESQKKDAEEKWKQNEKTMEERWNNIVDGEITDMSKVIDAVFKKYCDCSEDSETREDKEESEIEKFMLNAFLNLRTPAGEKAVECIQKLLSTTLSFGDHLTTTPQETQVLHEDEKTTEQEFSVLDKACSEPDNPRAENLSIMLETTPEKPALSVDISNRRLFKKSEFQKTENKDSVNPISEPETSLRNPPACTKCNKSVEATSEDSSTKPLEERITAQDKRDDIMKSSLEKIEDTSRKNTLSSFLQKEPAENADCSPIKQDERQETEKVTSENKSMPHEVKTDNSLFFLTYDVLNPHSDSLQKLKDFEEFVRIRKRFREMMETDGNMGTDKKMGSDNESLPRADVHGHSTPSDESMLKEPPVMDTKIDVLEIIKKEFDKQTYASHNAADSLIEGMPEDSNATPKQHIDITMPEESIINNDDLLAATSSSENKESSEVELRTPEEPSTPNAEESTSEKESECSHSLSISDSVIDLDEWIIISREKRQQNAMSAAAAAFAAAPDEARALGQQFREASRRRDVQRVLALQAAGADADARDARGETALHAAARAGRSDMMALLLGRRVGASAGAPNALGQTALHLAAAHGCARCVAQLLSRGADACAEDMFRRTPLHGAARWGRMAAARALLAAGALTKCKDSDGKTPLDLAMSPAVRELLRNYEETIMSAKPPLSSTS